jgi:hypothetical protein
MTQIAQSPKSPILVKRYWDRPIPREHGDPDSKPIFHAVGYSLTQWEDADQALIALFQELNRTGRSIESRYTMSRSYSSIESHRAQRIVLAATAEVYFSHHSERQDLRHSVAEIVSAAEWAADRRDDIAHGIAWQSISVDGRDVGSFLMPPEYRCEPAPPPVPDAEDPFGFVRAQYRYTSADILSFAAKFGDLRDVIWDCTSKIGWARPISAD